MAGNFIGTYNGGKFWVTDPKAEDVDIEAIAHALSQNCRFNGHTRFNWTVAQHSLLVAKMIECEDFIEPELKTLAIIAGLLHDASEGYMSDIASPFKHLLSQYLTMEDAVQDVIFEACGIKYSELGEKITKAVKQADLLSLAVEAKMLMNPCEDWVKFGDFSNPRIAKWESYIKLENSQVVEGKLIKQLYLFMGYANLLDKSTIFDKLGTDWASFPVNMSVPIFENKECKLFVMDKESCNNSYEIYRSYDYRLIAEIDKSELDNMQSLEKFFSLPQGIGANKTKVDTSGD